MSLRLRLAKMLAGDKYEVVDARKLEYERDSLRYHRDVSGGDMLAVAMQRQEVMYTLNGLPKFDYSRKLGKSARELITRYAGDLVKSAVHECCELENWLPWKPWSVRLGNKWEGPLWGPDHLDKIRDEVVDLLAFVFNLAILFGMTPTMLYERYCAKNDVNVNVRHESGTY